MNIPLSLLSYSQRLIIQVLTLSFTLTLAPIVSTDAQHGRPALPSAPIPSITSRHETSMPHHHPYPLFASLSIVLPTPMHIPFGSYLAIISDHHSHRSLHNGPPFLLSTFLFILPIPFGVHCLIPHTISQYLSLPLTIFSYTASLLAMQPYAHSFLFLSFNFPSHSYSFYRYIFILALTHLSSYWLNYSSSMVPSIPLVPTGR
jgi:hypothetical protein